MGFLTPIPIAVVTAAALVAAWVDVRKFRVPNALTFPLLIAGLAYHSVTGGWAGFQQSLLGAFFGFSLLIVLYIIGGVGAGDVKFLAAVGAWYGIVATTWVFAIAAVATSLYSVAILLRRGGVAYVVTVTQTVMLQLLTVGKHLGSNDRVEEVAQRADRRGRLVPFAAMVAFGVIVLVVWKQWFGTS